MKVVGALVLGFIFGVFAGYALGWQAGVDWLAAVHCEVAGGHIGPATHSCVFPR